MDRTDLSRREFLRKAGKAALAGATTLSYGFVTGCATFPEDTRGTFPKDARENVDQIKWDCNSILPIPKNGGIYIGTNAQEHCETQETIIDHFTEKYGKLPTFTAPGCGRWGASDDMYPLSEIEHDHRKGVIPMIRYIVNPVNGSWRGNSTLQGYKQINQGLKDDYIRRFAAIAARTLKKPIIVCPFQQPNDDNSNWRAWAGPETSGAFKEAYVRIYDIFEKEGALANVVMGVKLKVGRWKDWRYPDPLNYIPPSDKVDIIGWCANNHCQLQHHTPSKSFEGILETDYSRVVEKYPNIPQFIWELACHNSCNQAEWYDDALTKIEEKYHWIKGVNLDECPDGMGDFWVDPRPNIKSIKVIRDHFANPRYIGNILPPNGLLNSKKENNT